MNHLTSQQVAAFRAATSRGATQVDALAAHAGGYELAGGLWRLFSQTYPSPGVAAWNTAAVWKAEWGLAAGSFWTFGEDIFGNQLIVPSGSDISMLWGHEAGDLFDLYLPPLELVETVFEHGIEWVDYYIEGALDTGRARLAAVPPDSHLHWTTPLILGGQASEANTSVVERRPHLVGHAALWRQLSSLEPGATVVVKPG